MLNDGLFHTLDLRFFDLKSLGTTNNGGWIAVSRISLGILAAAPRSLAEQ